MPERQSMREAFAGKNSEPSERPARGEGLANILPPKPSRARKETQSTASKPAEAAQEHSVNAPGVLAPEASKKSLEANLGPENRGVYLPVELQRDLRQKTLQDNSTYTDILIDAFDALTDEQIKEKLHPKVASSSRMPRRRSRSGSSKSGTQIQLRLDAEQDSWLKGVEAEVDAPSRSALVTVVYDLYLSGLGN